MILIYARKSKALLWDARSRSYLARIQLCAECTPSEAVRHAVAVQGQIN
jgi:hypothetical protein